MNLIREKACAKINLTLEILEKRMDGFHSLKSVFQAVDLFDDFIFALREDGEINLITDFPEKESLNLINKAGETLKKFTSCPLGADITVKKYIPMGAGLGGGSSDAAAVLKGLNRLWNCGLEAKDLSFIGSFIGSDVPFFVTPSTALVEGRGEVISLLTKTPPFYFVLVFPRLLINTGWAYELWDKKGKSAFPNKTAEFVEALEKGDYSGMVKAVSNDFEPLVLPFIPPLKAVRDLLRESCDAASLSGSGSSYFGVVKDGKTAREIAGKLKKMNIGDVYALKPYQE